MKYQIVGDDLQAVIMDLSPGDYIRAEAGSVMYMTDSIQMETRAGNTSSGDLLEGLMAGVKRVVSGESFFITTFQAYGHTGQVAFVPPYPGKIVSLELAETGDMLCERGAFLCAESDIEISVDFTRRFGAGFWGGEGFILQRLSGTGRTFLHSGGLLMPFDLQAGQTLRVDTGCLVAFQHTVTYDIAMVKGVKSWLFGGEGLFWATLTGPGRVYLQTLPFSRMADRIIAASHIREEMQQDSVTAGVTSALIEGFIRRD